jgi:hypothetical protein
LLSFGLALLGSVFTSAVQFVSFSAYSVWHCSHFYYSPFAFFLMTSMRACFQKNIFKGVFAEVNVYVLILSKIFVFVFWATSLVNGVGIQKVRRALLSRTSVHSSGFGMCIVKGSISRRGRCTPRFVGSGEVPVASGIFHGELKAGHALFNKRRHSWHQTSCMDRFNYFTPVIKKELCLKSLHSLFLLLDSLSICKEKGLCR